MDIEFFANLKIVRSECQRTLSLLTRDIKSNVCNDIHFEPCLTDIKRIGRKDSMDTIAVESLGLASQFAIALILLSSGAGKLRNLPAFAEAVHLYEIRSTIITHCVIWGTPPIEIVLGFLWFLPPTRIVLGATLILFVSFIIVMANILRQKRHISCGCSGILQSIPIGWGTILRNVLLSGIATIPLDVRSTFNYTSKSIYSNFYPLNTISGLSTTITITGLFILSIVILGTLLKHMSQLDETRSRIRRLRQGALLPPQQMSRRHSSS
jgi:hypothetical protein